MDKGHLKQFTNKTQNLIFISFLFVAGISISLIIGLGYYTNISFIAILALVVAVVTVTSLLLSIKFPN